MKFILTITLLRKYLGLCVGCISKASYTLIEEILTSKRILPRKRCIKATPYSPNQEASLNIRLSGKFSLWRTGLILLLSIAAIPPAEARELQRLFTSPQERQLLDRLRRTPPPPVTTIPEDALPILESTDYVTLNGVVISANGTATVWANNQWGTYHPGFHVDMQNIAIDHVPIVLSAGEVCQLQPGQSLNTSTGQIHDILNPQPPCFISRVGDE